MKLKFLQQKCLMWLFLLCQSFGGSPETEDSRCQTIVVMRRDCESNHDTVNLSFSSRLYENKFTNTLKNGRLTERLSLERVVSGCYVITTNSLWGNKTKWVSLWENLSEVDRIPFNLGTWGLETDSICKWWTQKVRGCVSCCGGKTWRKK